MSLTRSRKTKLIATIGPACDNDEVLAELINAGVNVARLNFSHGSHEEHKVRIDRIRRVAAAQDANVAIMVDTKGFEIRTALLDGDEVHLKPGQAFTLYTDDRLGNEQGVAVSHKDLSNEINQGDPILIDDGAIRLEVNTIETDHIKCTVINGGLLGNRKGVNLPHSDIQRAGLTDADKQDLTFAAQQDVDYIAASFMQRAEDIIAIRKLIKTHNPIHIPIIAKIENKAGVENLEEIVAEADGIMVARGDLGVEVPLEQVPTIQKKIISTTVLNGKPVITATQMLDSMERSPMPTRAEVSDVANAIFDGTSAVMLSGETAIGKFPIETVRTMSMIAMQAEAQLDDYGYLQRAKPSESNLVTEAVSQAVKTMTDHLKAAAVICLTESGLTARMISKYRPECPIIAVCMQPQVVRRLSLNWGISAIGYKGKMNDKAKVAIALDYAKKHQLISEGDTVVVTAGGLQKTGGTDLIRVLTVE